MYRSGQRGDAACLFDTSMKAPSTDYGKPVLRYITLFIDKSCYLSLPFVSISLEVYRAAISSFDYDYQSSTKAAPTMKKTTPRLHVYSLCC
jgi:hypothetical protein